MAGAADASARTFHIRGTAYEFNNTDVRLAGATIRVAEHPRLHATTKSDGSYDLAVPDGATRHALHPGDGLPHHLPADLSDRRRGPRARQLPDADGRGLSSARHAARRPARRRRRAARLRDRVHVQHPQRPRPRFPAVHRVRGPRRRRRDRVLEPGPAAAALLQRAGAAGSGAAPLLDRRRGDLDRRRRPASTRSGHGIRRPASRASSPPAGRAESSTRTRRGACTSSASRCRRQCPHGGR